MDRKTGTSNESNKSSRSSGAEEVNLEEGTPKTNDYIHQAKASASQQSDISRSAPRRSLSKAPAALENHDEELEHGEADDHDYDLEVDHTDSDGKHRAIISPNTFSKEAPPKQKLALPQGKSQQDATLQHTQSLPQARPSPIKKASNFKREPEYESSMTLDVPGLHVDDQEGDDEMEMEFESVNSRGPGSVSASESEYSVSAGEEDIDPEPPQPP